MTKALLIIAILSVGCGGWSHQDTILEMTSQASLMADFYQTEEAISYYGGGEQNPIIGPRGERVPPAIYFPVAGILHMGIAAALPPKWRTAFQGVTIGVQAKTIYGNHQVLNRLEASRKRNQ